MNSVEDLVARWKADGDNTKYLIFPWADDKLHIAAELLELAYGITHGAEEMLCGRWIELDDCTPLGVVVRSTGAGSENLCEQCVKSELVRLA